jgi:hypothetical protein
MVRTRGPELSKEFHDHIATEYMFKGKNAYNIAEDINADTELMSQFGKTTPVGVRYHILKIQKDMEDTINEDAMDTYIAEFIRARAGFDRDIVDMEGLIRLAHEQGDTELELKLRRHRHEIKLDSFKMLQDSALPLQVKKLKKERERLRPKPKMELPKSEDIGERTSE